MKRNVGGWDRKARSVIGPLLLGWGARRVLRRGGRLGGLAAVMAGTMLGETAITGYCPLNRALGRNSRA
jgi:hypothetical protein